MQTLLPNQVRLAACLVTVAQQHCCVTGRSAWQASCMISRMLYDLQDIDSDGISPEEGTHDNVINRYCEF